MNQSCVRRGGNRVRRRGLAGLSQFLAKTILDPVQRAGQPIGDVVGQAFACENETPGADRGDRLRLLRIAVGGDRQRLEKRVPGADARDLVGVRRDESRAAFVYASSATSGCVCARDWARAISFATV